MKTAIVVLLTIFFSIEAYASECGDAATTHEVNECLNLELKKQKSELNSVFNKIYELTEAKTELKNAQKAWVTYRDLQCSDFVSADTGYSPATTSYTLSCLLDLNSQRIDYLKTVLKDY